MIAVLAAYPHFPGIVALLALLFSELSLFKADLSCSDQRRLVIVDLACGAAATLVPLTGLLRLGHSGKGLDFHAGNVRVHVTGAMFLCAALLSCYPARRFVHRLRAIRSGETAPTAGVVSRRIRRVRIAESVLLVLALLFAVLMARGIGMSA